MSLNPQAGIVRILWPNGTTAGTGFVISSDGLIATCSHVVQTPAVQQRGEPAPTTVRVVFFETGEAREANVDPRSWLPRVEGDVAILHLEGGLPDGVAVLPLGVAERYTGTSFRTWGFPAPRTTDGMWGTGVVVGQGPGPSEFGLLQLQSTEVTQGFSGAPVWDEQAQRVLGMITDITPPDRKYGRLNETAFAVPSNCLAQVAGTGLQASARVVAPIRYSEDRFLEYLGEDRFLLKLETEMIAESNRVRSELPDHNIHRNDITFSATYLRERIQRYEELVITLSQMFIIVSRWGKAQHRHALINSLEILAYLPGEDGGIRARPDIRLYPALFVVYTGGIAAVHSERYDILKILLIDAKARWAPSSDAGPLVLGVHSSEVMQPQNATILSTVGQRYGPLNAYLLARLRELFVTQIPLEHQFEAVFHRFEYFLALVHADIHQNQGLGWWGPPGRLFLSGHRRSFERDRLIEEIGLEAKNRGDKWPPLRAGLFNGSIDRFFNVKQAVDSLFKNQAPW